MFYVVTTEKTFEKAASDLTSAIEDLGFGVLYVHNLGESLRSRDIDFNEECKIFEICNPERASEVLSINMSLNMALPCRISVFTEDNTTKIGIIKSAQMLSSLSDDSALASVANSVEDRIMQMVDKAS